MRLKNKKVLNIAYFEFLGFSERYYDGKKAKSGMYKVNKRE